MPEGFNISCEKEFWMKKQSNRFDIYHWSLGTVLILGAAVPFVIYSLAYFAAGVFPFGDKILLDSDSFQQYLPFLTEFRRKLTEGGSLFYSFSGGLGYDFWASFSYYASSPLNLFLLFIPESHVCDFMMWATVLKIALSGGIFSWYLFKQDKSNALHAITFGAMYSCSYYFIGYKFNFMWLDSIAVVPFVMAGLEDLVHNKRCIFYLISLFFAIWCNYYIGYMICIFSCLYFIFLLVTEMPGVKNCVRHISLFTLSSLTAAGMAAVLLIPSYLALRTTTSLVSGESSGIRFYNNFIDMLRAHYLETEAFRANPLNGSVHLYCGLAVLFLAALFFTEKKISKNQRIGYGIILGFLLLSFSFSPLNFLWHGFHNQNNVPNRFSFLYVLLLLKICYIMLPMLKDVEEKRLNKIVLGVFVLSVIFFIWDLIAQHKFRISLSFAFLMLYTVLLFEIRSTKKGKTQTYSLVLCVLLVVEAAAAVWIDTSLNSEGRVRSDVLNWKSSFQQLMTEQDDSSFYRSEVDNDSFNFMTLLGGNAVSLFNSTMQDNICSFLEKMNIHSELNAVLCRTPAKLMADFLGIRYFFTEETSSEIWNGFRKVSSVGNKTLYKNDNALSLGFLVPEEFSSWQPLKSDGMDGLNSLAKVLSDLDEFCSLQEEYSGESGESVSFPLTEEETLYVTIDTKPREVSWETPEYSGFYATRLSNLLLAAKATAESDTAVLTVVTGDDSSYSGKVFSCRQEDYNLIWHILSRNQLEDVSVDSNHVSGSIVADSSGILLMTIPYNKGWRISVDGIPSSFEEIGGALIGIPLEAGTHEIEMRYIPQGFIIGCALSLFFLLFTCVFIFWQYKARFPKTDTI